VECTALSRLAFHPHPAAHQVEDSGRDGETEAASTVFPRGRGVGLFECLEDGPVFPAWDANTSVANCELKRGLRGAPIDPRNVYLDPALTGELHCVTG